MLHEPGDTHYTLVARAIAEGSLVPFLGAGASLCSRPPLAHFERGRYLPDSAELSACLSSTYPAEETPDLLHVAQFVYVMEGSGPLYERLRNVFDTDYPVTDLHAFLASIPGTLAARHYPAPHLLVMTTNYDDLVERAFAAAGVEHDVVWYVADGEHRGKFRHRTPGGEVRLIERPNEYGALSLKERSIVLKIHGAVSRTNPEDDSYVIAEDHYIDYLTRTDISALMQVTLAAKVKRSHFLFLGYSLADWNMRVILNRIWGGQQLTYTSWAVQRHPKELEIECWKKRGADILNVNLADYVSALRAKVTALRDFKEAP
jgi:hypothetical protein